MFWKNKHFCNNVKCFRKNISSLGIMRMTVHFLGSQLVLPCVGLQQQCTYKQLTCVDYLRAVSTTPELIRKRDIYLTLLYNLQHNFDHLQKLVKVMSRAVKEDKETAALLLLVQYTVDIHW